MELGASPDFFDTNRKARMDDANTDHTGAAGKRAALFRRGHGHHAAAGGAASGDAAEEWNLARPEVIRDIHRQYAQAGCQILKTNTFGANRLKFGERTETVIAAAVGLAKEAAGQSGPGRRMGGHGYRPHRQVAAAAGGAVLRGGLRPVRRNGGGRGSGRGPTACSSKP